jgi:beta-galactosidase beta subunit
MKKLLIIILTVSTFLMVGCANKEDKKIDEYKSLMEEYSKDYFEKYVVQGLDRIEVSIDMLEKANQYGTSNYDLELLKECSKNSKVIIFFKKDSQKIEKYEHILECK